MLHRYEILDTPAERPFDDLATLASHLCETPFALISFVASDREWFKARVGISIEAIPLDLAFGAHAILQSDVFVVADASTDARFDKHPLVTGTPCVRFYAAAPVETIDGHCLGTICVVDKAPRVERVTTRGSVP